MNTPTSAIDYANEIQNELDNRNESENNSFLTLVKWITRIQSQSFNQGLERAAKLIAPANPEARSPSAEIRNQCSREIRDAIH